jgi:hypothetical protein
MKTFYTLHVRRKDGSWRHHIMRGVVPKVGAKVGAVTDPTLRLRKRGEVIIDVHADEV